MTGAEVDEIVFTMDDEDPFFFRHDALLPYRHEARCARVKFLSVFVGPKSWIVVKRYPEDVRI